MARQYDVDDEDVGIRTFQLRKQRAAERAIDKIRHHLGEDWADLESKEIEVLAWALGETWALMGFYEWDRVAFGDLNLDTLRRIVEIGQDIMKERRMGTDGFQEIHQILRASQMTSESL